MNPMDDISNKTNEELLTLVMETDDKEVLRFIANELEVTFSGNTGNLTLKEKIVPVLEARLEAESKPDEDDPIMAALASKPEVVEAQAAAKKERKLLDLPKTALAEIDPHTPGLSDIEKRAIVRAKAMRLHRVRVSNLDPADSSLQGAIVTVYNKFTGKVSKYIPFGEENDYGWHVPEILINELKSRTFNVRKEVKRPGQSFGVKEYRTVQQRKFAIEYLEPLTAEELKNLGNDQKARGAIDTTAA